MRKTSLTLLMLVFGIWLGIGAAPAGAIEGTAAGARVERPAVRHPVRHRAVRARAHRVARAVHRKAVARHVRARHAAAHGRKIVASRHVRHMRRVSVARASGLHSVVDPLYLRSAVALVVDQNTGETLYQKNSTTPLPIASITKLMTAMVVLDAHLPLAEIIDVGPDDVDLVKHTHSRLAVGTRLSRGELLNLALMSSENRAAHSLGRHYPGGLPAFVKAMNDKARALGMTETHFVEPTGLSSQNVASAHDLSLMVRAAYEYPLIRQFSTATGLTVETGRRLQAYHSTNRLIENPAWTIGLQKTGFINEAGSCLVMQTTIEGRQLVVVLLDAQGIATRFADARRIRGWIEAEARRPPPRQVAGSI